MAITSCEKAAEWQKGVGIFDAMTRAEVQPDVVSYSAAMSSWGKVGKWQAGMTNAAVLGSWKANKCGSDEFAK